MTEQYQSLILKSRALGPVLQDIDSYSSRADGTSGLATWSGTRFKGDPAEIVTQGFQMTWSRDNPWPASRGAVGSVGGPFRTLKAWWSTHPGGKPASYEQLFPRIRAYDFPQTTRFWRIYPYPSPAHFGMQPNGIMSDLIRAKNDQALISDGTRAIERCKPTRTTQQLLTALIELKRDGIPASVGSQFVDLWRDFRKTRRKSLPRSAKQMLEDFHAFIKTGGSEHLNLVFGWFPTLSDTQKLLATYDKLPKIWEQYERDAGRRVRRRYSFPTEESTLVRQLTPYGVPTMTAYAFPGPQVGGKDVVTRSASRWFTGAFRYYLPDRKEDTPVAELFRFAAYANKCYGLAPTPDNIWNVIPWTWALDWASNVGSVVSNLSDAMVNGLVTEYGYMCERISYLQDASLDLVYFTTPLGDRGALHNRAVLNIEYRNRIEASPYGFGIGWDNFSPSQLAILAAIGITRF